MDMINDNPDKPWHWLNISYHANSITEMVKNNPEKLWDWGAMSSNCNLSIETIENNPNKPWVWYYICVAEFKRDKIHCISQILKMALLLKLYYYYDTTITRNMNDIEFVLYDKGLSNQIALY